MRAILYAPHREVLERSRDGPIREAVYVVGVDRAMHLAAHIAADMQGQSVTRSIKDPSVVYVEAIGTGQTRGLGAQRGSTNVELNVDQLVNLAKKRCVELNRKATS